MTTPLKKSLPADTYTPYKDLQPYREYPLTDLFDIHKQIITLLSTLNGYIVSRDHDLNNYQNKSNIGLTLIILLLPFVTIIDTYSTRQNYT